MRKLLVVVGFAALCALFVVIPVGSATRTPGDSCQAVGGGGMICRSFEVEPRGPLDTGIVCESATGAFDIFDHFVKTRPGPSGSTRTAT